MEHRKFSWPGLKLLALIFLSLSVLGACAKKGEKKSTIKTARTVRGDTTTGGGPIPRNAQGCQGLNGRGCGEIFAGSLSEDDFFYWVQMFLSVGFDPFDSGLLGFVSGRPGDSTGIRFWGQVTGEDGPIDPSGRSFTYIDGASAELLILIWDSYAGKVSNQGETIPEIPVEIRGGEGIVDGDYAYIVFEDRHGLVELEGTFTTSRFEGEIWFENHQYWDGEAPCAAGPLGEFSIPTCDFFRCR